MDCSLRILLAAWLRGLAEQLDDAARVRQRGPRGLTDAERQRRDTRGLIVRELREQARRLRAFGGNVAEVNAGVYDRAADAVAGAP